MKHTALNQPIFTFHKSSIKYLSILQIVAIVLVIGLCFSCSSKTSNKVVEQVNSDIHVSYAGGGWRAHTGHAAWVMSLLDANNTQAGCTLSGTSGNSQCLDAAFANVKTISGNSGGSWFSTMLMYDSSFVNAITNVNAIKNWGDPIMRNPNQGWLGKQQNYFASFSSKCGSKHGPAYLECVLENYFSPSPKLPTPNWSQFVETVVYTGYEWKTYGNLNSKTHQPWAKDKSLLMAGTLLTNAVVLNDQDDEIYYQVCMSPLTVKTDGDDGSWCVDPITGKKKSIPDVLPVTFSSLAENKTTLKAPAFIGSQAHLFNLGYSGAYTFSSTPTKSNTLQSGHNKTDNVSVMWASAASSAAAGYAASYTVSDPHLPSKCDASQWDCVYHLRNLALGFKIPQNTNQVAFVPDATLDKISLKDLNTERVMRIADGGAIDNSGIAQLIGYLQLNNQDSNFNIVAFDDVQKNDARDQRIYPSSDISYLFEGAPNSQVCVQGVCIQVPELSIVKSNTAAPYPITKYSWTVVDQNGQKTSDFLYYYSYEVETIANTSFNIRAGSKGTIHVFASQFACADTAPENNNDFSCYNDMLKNFKSTLKLKPNNGTSTKTGFTLLSEAFGL